MTPKTIRSPNRVLRLWAAALVLLFALLAPAGAAAAPQVESLTKNDIVFLQVLAAQGINAPDNATLINAGHLVCSMLDEGFTPIQVAAAIYRYTQLDAYDSGFFVGAAIGAYCPEHSGQV